MKKSCLVLFVLVICACAFGANISEDREVIKTYPFGEADPVPIFVRDSIWGLKAKMYPYSFIDEFSDKGVDKEWTVVTMDNPYIEVTVMPEIGGKVWGAKEKSTGNEFIYSNDVVKFREIALRGPWTSGGIEFNFGLVGHTPGTATPVDYITRKNRDGSVSCIVGTMDLVSRSRWSVEIRLPKDKAYFETNAFYYNPSAIDQSYYCWTNSGVKVGEDMQLIYPGLKHIAHSFEVPLKDWPVGEDGRDLSWYKNNRFGSHKSYFTVGEYEDFFGCYWHDDAFGTGHWAKYEDTPGQKLWLWALSRQGGVWEDLLTDKKGQYAELQGGRFFNQNDHGFLAPGSGDMWREVWFPYKEIGPMVKASDEAVLNVSEAKGGFKVAVCAIGRVYEDLVVKVDGKEVLRKQLRLKPMQTYETVVKSEIKGVVSVRVGDMLSYTTDKKANDIEKPIRFHEVYEGTSEGLYMAGVRQEKWRGYAEAMEKYQACLKEQPRHVRAMCRIAGLYLRSGELDKAIAMAGEAINEDMYDAGANYIYGIVSRRMGKPEQAKESLGWAARSMEYRSMAYCQRAEICIEQGNWGGAAEYAQMSLDYNRYNINALQAMAIAMRKTGETRDARDVLESILEIEPLNHYARFEAYLLTGGERKLKVFTSLMRSEYANETYVEMGVYYAELGLVNEAVELFTLAGDYPTAVYWKAYLLKSKALLDNAGGLSPRLVFPYREESIKVFDWAVKTDGRSWKAKYSLGLIYLSKGRIAEARELINGLDAESFVPFYIARAYLNMDVDPAGAGNDLRAAVIKGEKDKRGWHHLITYYIDQEKYGEAINTSRKAVDKVPGEQVLELDLVRGLVGGGEFAEALEILDRTTILPFEGASEIHELYVKCHKGLGVSKMAGGWYGQAIKHFEASKEYPERLGTGKPYEPDFRMQDYMNSLCYDVTGKKELAAKSIEAVARYTAKHPEDTSEGAYYGRKVLIMKGKVEKAKSITVDQQPVKQVIDAIEKVELKSTKVSYGVGNWEPETYGNHRAVIEIRKKAEAVLVHVPWRRRDKGVEGKGVVLLAEGSDEPITNILPVRVNREAGEFLFEPVDGVSKYYLYYMPYIKTGSYYPQVEYIKADYSAKPEWANKDKFVTRGFVTQFQSVDELNSFYPMEVIATEDEVENLVGKADFVLFPEDRKYPIRMVDDLPRRWADRGLSDVFEGTAQRGEFYAFQVGVYANSKAISDLEVSFGDLKRSGGGSIKASAMRCFNTGGISWDGSRFDKVCSVGKGQVRALWCGIEVHVGAKAGKYEGVVRVGPKGGQAASVKLIINIDEKVIADAGDSEPWRHSRLRWLDSTIGLDDELVKPYTPLEVRLDTVNCLGRDVQIGKGGLPSNIRSYFTAEVTSVGKESTDILAGPMTLVVEDEDGEVVNWKGGDHVFTRQDDGIVKWESASSAGSLKMLCLAQMEFDGFCQFVIEVTAGSDTVVDDIRLEMPYDKANAMYMMGMGIKGGMRPNSLDWKWNWKKNHDGAWLGSAQAGLQFSLRDENYERPLNTNFYLSKPLLMPKSWDNGGKGGCTIEDEGETLMVTAYSGKRTIKAGEKLYYNFNLLITPFKPIDTNKQWATRFYHAYKPIDEIASTGANTINNHHANEINPYINYPFIRTKEMRDYVDQAHQLGMKVKIYYTVRELANRASELFALRSLDDEILSYGPGGGYSWLQEHLGDNYIGGWFVDRYKDAAVINSGVSRWHNYYLEGLNWLVANIGIDGIYIDDVAYDRTVMKRVRKILDRGNEGALIDLHSANQFNPRDGFINSANLYLEHLAYIDRLWFGEYFEYDRGPDYWLIEVSGIPFGVMGEMLQDNGNPWRGMVYGMTARMPRTDMPGKMWKVWDEFGLADSEMIGYWSPNCPVRSGRERVPVTAYVKDGKAMIAMASWEKATVNCKLDIDFKAIGIASNQAVLWAPAIEGFQNERTFEPGQEIPVEPSKGWLLILKSK